MEAIILDADYTLYIPESERAYEKKFSFLEDETGVDSGRLAEAWEKAVSHIEQNHTKELVRRKTLIREMLERVGVDPSEDLVESTYELFWNVVEDDLGHRPDVEEMLQQLSANHVVAIASDEFPEALEIKLEKVFDQQETIFDQVITPEDTGEMKPSPLFFSMILDHRGIEPEDTVMVGDSWERDLEPAKEMGLNTVMIRTGEPADPLATPQGVSHPDPDVFIDHILELASVLEEL